MTPTAVMAATDAPALTSSQQGTALQFNIPAGPLDAAIAEFRRITGLRVVFADPNIGTVQSPGAIGSLTPARAMEMLLDKTLVRAISTSGGFRLEIRASEFVSAQADVPRVQSPKYQAPLLDTAQTVVIIPQRSWSNRRPPRCATCCAIRRASRWASAKAPAAPSAAGDNIFIRGFNARNDIYIDGARDPGEVSRDMFNTESVEVAKGPTSVTGGRGATGGSINLVTKSANLQDSASVRLTGGNADHKRAHLRRQSQADRFGRVPLERHVAGRRLSRAATSRRTRAGALRRRWRSAWARRRRSP